MKGKKLIGGMVYHNYHPEHEVMEMSGASDDPRWLTNETLHQLFAYPFNQVGCQLVIMRVSERNKRLERILVSYGFKCYTIPRLRGRNEAERLWTLTDDDWRNNKFEKRYQNGQAKTSVAA